MCLALLGFAGAANAQNNPNCAAPCPDEVRLASFSDGRATAEDQHEIEAHLAECRDCLDALLDLRTAEAGSEIRAFNNSVQSPTTATTSSNGQYSINVPLANGANSLQVIPSMEVNKSV